MNLPDIEDRKKLTDVSELREEFQNELKANYQDAPDEIKELFPNIEF